MSASEQLRQLMLRLGREIDSHDLEQLRVPDSSAVDSANALAAEGQSPTLTNYGLRSYGFGALLGIREGRAFDAEVFYFASILHDIGLIPAFDRAAGSRTTAKRRPASCLRRSVGSLRAPSVRGRRSVTTATARRTSARDVESLLLAYGMSVDVRSRRLDEFTRATLEAFLDSAPRCGFKEHFIELVEGKVARDGDPHLEEMAVTGLAGRVRPAPFAE